MFKPRANEGGPIRAPSLVRICADMCGSMLRPGCPVAGASAAYEQAHHFLHFTRKPRDFSKDLPLGGFIERRLQFQA
jgi:hypothetical protein